MHAAARSRPHQPPRRPPEPLGVRRLWTQRAAGTRTRAKFARWSPAWRVRRALRARRRARTRTSCSSTTACSGAPPRPIDAPAQAPPEAAVRPRHRRSPPTTCRSTRIPSWATTRCSPQALGATDHEPVRPAIGVRARLPDDLARGPRRARARGDGRPRAARVPRRARTRCARIGIVSGGAAEHLDDAIARGPGRLPDRRAARAVR